mmetsp:Transcript_15995/g.16593  ORF Transcript_15995/g.16593 Transcript_15995/m.16593 type:complete len:255 (+) Transcript_15995:2-766(+)
MMVPEEGVTIIEGKKKKGGTTNFLKAFHKHSKYDYMTMLKETMGSTTLRDTMEQLMGSMKDDDFKSKDQLSLPPIKHEKASKEASQMGSPSLKYATTVSQKDSIQLNPKNRIVSMRNALESLSVQDDKLNQINFNEKTQNSNFFKDKNIKEKFIESLSTFNAGYYNNTMNNFNQTIMTNTNWGTSQGQGSSIKRFNMTMDNGKRVHKPGIKQVELELGKNMVHSKLPRARMKSEIMNPEEMLGNPIKKKSIKHS